MSKRSVEKNRHYLYKTPNKMHV